MSTKLSAKCSRTEDHLGLERFGHLAETPLSIGARACLGTGTKPRVFQPSGRNTRVVTSGCTVHPDR
ncbi:uncharacterized protein G2W53_010624 [Senna tora]|uniref:Uncharacterized protein n=1 Tax=Senna tora TaxID=362788 RepID=A0A834X153_9FABA|nr:uncharacterized protein G2W53_010624 [Senna tora]